MNRKKLWFYAIFSIVIIVGLAVALVLVPKSDEPDSKHEGNSETYASYFYVEVPNTIEIPVGMCVNFLEGYIAVTPSNMINKLNIEISTSTGIEFLDNKLMATAVGDYTIKFKMPKSESTFFSKTISVKVKSMEESPIKLIKESIVRGETIHVNDVFNIAGGVQYSVVTNENFSIVDGALRANNTGDGKVLFSVIESKLQYVYAFDINIKEPPEYKILLNNVLNNRINLDLVDDTFHINFAVQDQNNEYVKQTISVVSSDENVVLIESVADDALIKIRAVAIGNAKITISIASNLNIFVEIDVIVN